MSQDRNFIHLPPNPNSSEDNDSGNTTRSHDHNANAQNQNTNAFNTYIITDNTTIVRNNPSNEIESETLPPPPNPDSLLPGTTIHQRQEWLRVSRDGPGPKYYHGARLERINAQGGQEWRLPLTDGTEREIMIVVMGVTGAGKSYFIREVSGISDVEVASGLHAVTTDVQPYSFPYAGVKVTLVDTPGFNDTTKSDTQVLIDISAWMSSNYRKGKLLSGIIYLHNINDVRMGGSSVMYVKMLQRLCGPNALPNMLLTTTQWSNVDQGLREKREGELCSGDRWGGLIRGGAFVKRFMGTRESGLELIDKLMGNQPKPLDIQHQMVEEAKALAQTNAGEYMSEELISLQKKFLKNMENLKRDLSIAVREKDDLFREFLEEQLAESRNQLEEVIAQWKLLQGSHVDKMKELEEAEARKQKEREERDRAVIAVALEDIRGEVHFPALFTADSTRGRLIYDINNPREFKQDSFEVGIRYQPTTLAPIELAKKAAARVYGRRKGSGTTMTNANFITYNQGYYQCRPDFSVVRGSQDFIIFAKY